MGLATNWLAAALLAASILFYVLVYTVWLKPRTAAEHRHRRRRRRLPAADRLGCRDRPCRGAAAAAVRDHLPVDAAAFLGAVAVRPLGLCRGRDPDAAGRRGRREHPPADLPLQPADGGGGDRAVAARPDRPDLRRLRRRSSASCSWCSPRASLANRATEPAAMEPEKHLFAYSVFYLFALFAVLVADRWLPW